MQGVRAISTQGNTMATQDPNGRTSHRFDERSWRPQDADERYERGDRDRMMRPERHGGQSGYGAGDRGSSRAEGSWEDRGDRYHSGYNQGGMGYGGYGTSTEEGARRDSMGSWDQGGMRGNMIEQRTWDRQRAYDEPRGLQRGSYGSQSGYGGYGQGGYAAERGGFRGKGPRGYTRTDERIRELVCEALTDDDDVDASHIEVVVKDGEVMLTGTVDDRRQKRLAEDCAERVSGVRDVQNQLRVGRSNPNLGSAVGKTETETSANKHRG